MISLVIILFVVIVLLAQANRISLTKIARLKDKYSLLESENSRLGERVSHLLGENFAASTIPDDPLKDIAVGCVVVKKGNQFSLHATWAPNRDTTSMADQAKEEAIRDTRGGEIVLYNFSTIKMHDAREKVMATKAVASEEEI